MLKLITNANYYYYIIQKTLSRESLNNTLRLVCLVFKGKESKIKAREKWKGPIKQIRDSFSKVQ